MMNSFMVGINITEISPAKLIYFFSLMKKGMLAFYDIVDIFLIRRILISSWSKIGNCFCFENPIRVNIGCHRREQLGHCIKVTLHPDLEKKSVSLLFSALQFKYST